MRRVLVILTIALAAWGQEKPAAEAKARPSQARIYQLKHGDADRIAHALANIGVPTSIERRLNVLVVRADPGMMTAIDNIVQALDAPVPAPKNVELTFYILQASTQSAPDSNIPDDLQPVLKQLRGGFGYQSFQLLDTAFIRTREDRNAMTSGLLSNTAPYSLRLNGSVVSGTKERVIRIDNLRFESTVPMKTSMTTGLNFNADVDVKEGQKVVIGKAGLQGSDRALVLVVSGHIVD